MKKLILSCGILFLLIFISFSGGDSVTAQNAENEISEKGELANNELISSGDVDSSFAVANLLTVWNQGVRASVAALARQPDGKILVAGNFSYANGAARFRLVRLNSDGSVDSQFNPPGVGPILRIVPLPDGKILVGGNFSNLINGTIYGGITRLNEDGSIDNSFGINVQGTVSAIAVQPDGKILVGGSFVQVNGFSLPNFARLNTDGSLDTSFQIGVGVDNTVNAIAVLSGGKILVGGAFNNIAGNAKPRLARLNADGSFDATFNAGGSGTGNSSGPVNSIFDIILQPDNKILISGVFTTYNNVTRDAGIARLNVDGTLDDTFAPTSSVTNQSGVKIILQPDGKIIASFLTSLSTSSTLSTLNRYNADGTSDGSFNGSVKAPVSAMILESNGKIVIGGSFTQLNGVSKNALARINGDGSSDNNFNLILAFSCTANVIAIQPDGKILVGGGFDYVNETAKNGLVRFNADGSIDETFTVTGNFASSGFTNLSAIVPASQGKIFISGSFSSVNGQNVNRIVRLKSDGSTDTGFNLNGTGPNGSVTNISIQPDGKILLSGNFYTFNGTSRPGIVRLNDDGSIDNTFAGQFTSNSSISAMKLQSDGKILLGGNFTIADNSQRRGMIRLNSDGSIDQNYSSLADYTVVRAIAVQPDGKILIGGAFTSINGVGRRNIARLNRDGSLDLTFNPGGGANNPINAIVLEPDGKILIGGEFGTFNGIRRNRLARLNSDGSLDNFNVDPGANGTILALAQQADGRLLVGGSFLQIGGLQRVGLARVRLPRNAFTPLFDFDGDGKTDIAVFRPTSGAWYQIKSSDGNFDGRLFGVPTDRIVPGDFDGDRKTDLAVWRPSSGHWFILKSSTNEVIYQQFGSNGDIPLAADYDGDGKDDLAVFRPSDGAWYILRSRDGFQSVQFGMTSDIPLPGDFDGDGKSDVAIYRPSNGTWYILPSAGGFSAVAFGVSEDIPVTGDYDGDGKTDFTVFRPSNGTWYVLGTTQGFFSIVLGVSTDRPAAGDYDGDGKTDLAVFRPASGVWYLILSSNGALRQQIFGMSGDVPVPAAYLR